MLNEPASHPHERPGVLELIRDDEGANEDARLEQIRLWVMEIFAITAERLPQESELRVPARAGLSFPGQRNGERTAPDENVAPSVLNPNGRLLIAFDGRLKLDSELAYEQLDAHLQPLNLVALFRQTPTPDDALKQSIAIVEGRINPKPRSWIPNLILFVLTLFTVLYVGMERAISEIAAENVLRAFVLEQNGLRELWRGLPFAISILLILGAHELGHYFAARRHRIAVTLPYFLPFPGGQSISLIGTLGAFIQLRQPIRNRKMLLEIGAAGPLAGLVFAIPILLIGLATSPVSPMPSVTILEGNSLLYALSKIITFGRFLPQNGVDVYLNQMAWAGWTGLLLTGLNLIPVGQLDGGHVLYSLIGNRARVVYIPVMVVLAGLMIASGGSFIFLLILLFLLGRTYAVPLDDITPLDRPRQLVALFTIAVFLLVFVPTPLTIYTSPTTPTPFPGTSVWLPFVMGAVVVLYQRFRRGHHDRGQR